MPTAPLYEVRRGAVIDHDSRHWLVLAGGMGPFPHGFYPPYLFTLQPLPSGPTREVRLYGGRDRLDVVPVEERVLQFACNQRGELLFFDPASSEMVSLPEDRTDVDPDGFESGAEVVVRYFGGLPLWVARQPAPGTLG